MQYDIVCSTALKYFQLYLWDAQKLKYILSDF